MRSGAPPRLEPGSRLGLSTPALREALERLAAAYGRPFLHTDPLELVRRHSRPEDAEIAGLLAAGLAYGRVETIRASLDDLLSRMGPSPRRFVEGLEPRDVLSRFDGFVHRFTTGRDVGLLLWLARQAIERSGSLERFFIEGDPDSRDPTLERAMNAFGRRLFSLDARPFHREGLVPCRAGTRWLLPLPENGSVSKRHCLYLRWMVRAEDGLDCGAWRGVRAARLVVPLDTHLLRVARSLGWTRRASPSWAMALEVTAALRELDPEDPVRFDFALCRLGVLGRLGSGEGRGTVRRLLAALREVGPGALRVHASSP